MSDCSCADSATESHWTPRVLPCVYLFPPEEDEASIVCVFPNNRPDPFAATPRTSGDVFYQLPDALDDEEGTQYGVPTYSSYSVSYQGTRPNGRSRSTNAQSAKTLNRKRNRAAPYAPVSHIPNECDQNCEEEAIFIPPSSRRSSVFEDRSSSPEPVTFKNLDVSLEESSSAPPLEVSIKSSSSSFKEKARTAFKTFRRPTLRREKEPAMSQNTLELSTEPAVVGPSHEENFFAGLKKKKNRRSLMSFFNSSSSSINTTVGVEHHTQNPTDLNSPVKGKTRPMSSTYSFTSGSRLVPDAEKSKLSRRRSITQIFSRKRPSSEPNKSENQDQAQTCDPPTERRRSLSTPSESETGDDDEPKSPVIMLSETTDIVMEDDSDLVPTDRGLSRPRPLNMGKINTDFSTRFSLHVDDNPSSDSPIMELAVQLNSLDFNHLDAGAYSDTNEDD